MAAIIGSGLESYLRRQARERAMNQIAKAREKAREILEQAAAEAERVRQEIQAKAHREIAEQRKRALAQARLNAQQMIIRRREEFLERLWQEVARRLQRFDDQEKRLVAIERLLEDAIAQLGEGPVLIQVNDQDRALLVKELRRLMDSLQFTNKMEISQDPASIWGGVIVRRLDSNQLVDNSFNYRLAVAKATLRDTVYRLLTSDCSNSSETWAGNLSGEQPK